MADQAVRGFEGRLLWKAGWSFPGLLSVRRTICQAGPECISDMQDALRAGCWRRGLRAGRVEQVPADIQRV